MQQEAPASPGAYSLEHPPQLIQELRQHPQRLPRPAFRALRDTRSNGSQSVRLIVTQFRHEICRMAPAPLPRRASWRICGRDVQKQKARHKDGLHVALSY